MGHKVSIPRVNKQSSQALSSTLLVTLHNGPWAPAAKKTWARHAKKRNEQMAALRERDEMRGAEDSDRKALAPGEAAHRHTAAQEG